MFYESQHIGADGYFRREEGENFSYPIHVHRCCELILLTAGEMTVNVGGVEYLTRAGEAVLILPHQPHGLTSTASRHTLFIFPPDLIRAFASSHRGAAPDCPRFRLPPPLFCALSELRGNASQTAMKGLLYSAAACLEEQTAFSPRTVGDDLLAKIFSFIDENHTGECSLGDLSRALGYDPSYLCRYFRKTTGMAYHRYVSLRRLGHAAGLLRDGEKNILGCAVESGYRSLRSFNRNFREQYGCTPGEYRKSTPLIDGTRGK